MSEHNLSLFDDPDAALLLDQMEHIPTEELAAKWPERISALFHVLQSELSRNGIDTERSIQLAAKCAGAIAWYMGGRAMYFPTGESMTKALRDNLIFAEFTGNNIEALSHKYHLSHPTLYQIIAAQRKALSRRLQPDMFA